MITDAYLKFSNAQAIDGTVLLISENVVDLGPFSAGNAGRDMGVGHPLSIYVRAENRATVSGTLTVGLYTHDASGSGAGTAIGSWTRIWVTPSAPSLTVASGALYTVTRFRVPFATMSNYLALGYTASADLDSNLLITAGIVLTQTQYRQYASGLNFA